MVSFPGVPRPRSQHDAITLPTPERLREMSAFNKLRESVGVPVIASADHMDVTQACGHVFHEFIENGMLYQLVELADTPGGDIVAAGVAAGHYRHVSPAWGTWADSDNKLHDTQLSISFTPNGQLRGAEVIGQPVEGTVEEYAWPADVLPYLE